jgi:hypothetical protein
VSRESSDASLSCGSYLRSKRGRLLGYASIIILLVPFSLLGHSVGEPELEKELIWKHCCSDHDCVPQQVNILGEESNGKVPVEIEHSRASVSKEKFFPVASSRTWVCYNGANQR